MLADSIAVICLSWGLDQKKSGTEPILTNQMDHGIGRRNVDKFLSIQSSDISCLQ